MQNELHSAISVIDNEGNNDDKWNDNMNVDSHNSVKLMKVISVILL